MERLDIFPLRVTESLALITFHELPGRGSATTYHVREASAEHGGDALPDHSSRLTVHSPIKVLFDYLHQNGIKTELLTEGFAENGKRRLVLVISEAALERCVAGLRVLHPAMPADRMHMQKPVAIIRILGPHFDIRPGIAGVLFARLLKAGIQLLANSTTMTSSLLVIPEEQVEQTIRAVESVFRMPKSRP